MTPVNVEVLRPMLERAGDGAFVIGADGRIVLWNRAAERILGYPAREVLGRPCCDVFVGMDDSGNRLCYRGCHIMTLVGLGEPVQSFDMRTRARGGRAVWVNISILSVPADTSDALVRITTWPGRAAGAGTSISSTAPVRNESNACLMKSPSCS